MSKIFDALYEERENGSVLYIHRAAEWEARITDYEYGDEGQVFGNTLADTMNAVSGWFND